MTTRNKAQLVGYILGISAFYHDSAACLIRDGEIIAAAQEERFTRKKHDFSFPKNAVQFCLSQAGIKVEDLAYVAFYDKPFVKFERIIKSYLAYAPLGIKSFLQAMPMWLKQKLFLRDIIKDELGSEVKVIFPEHHQSHAASAFYPSPFQESAFLTVDGVGEWTTTSYGVGKDNKIDLLAELKFPHSVGLLYSAFTYYTGFKVNSGEYKLMGLAPYGEPKYVDIILRELVDLKPDGSFKLNLKYFDYCVGLKMTNERFDKLFGAPARNPESRVEQRHMDLARSVQVVTEKIILRMAWHIQRETGQKNLCLAGGVALNCVANGKIFSEKLYDNIWIQPAAGDAGGALGAALFVHYTYLDNPRKAGERDSQHASYLGPGFNDGQIEGILKSKNIPYEKLNNGDVAKRVAKLIADEKVVGWFQGRMEFGPRALGSRSIIGDPRSPEMQSVMNLKIKYRESFRPFAPSVLREYAPDYFEFKDESPYMLVTAPVREEKRRKLTPEEEKLFGIEKLKTIRSDVPAITHVDYSARLQTVDKGDNPLYHSMIKAFYDLTGCPIIINTSFNVRGEPIVCTPEDAYTCFMRTQMDYLIMGNYLLDKTKQPKWDEDFDWRDHFVAD